MIILIIALIISASITAFWLILTIKYKNYLSNIYHKREKEEKEKSLDELLDKYVVKEKKDLMKEKLSKISQIIADTEKEIQSVVAKKIEVVKEQKAELKAEGRELEIIKQAQTEYFSHSAGMVPAIPETEEERKSDMSELKNVIGLLESFDEESYRVGPKQVGAGLGMFYDKMAGHFKKIIKEQKLDENKFIPVKRIKYHAFQEIKNIKDKDILPVLEVMKDTNLLKDLIEINAQFKIILFSDEKIKLSMPEKVLMSFAYEEDHLTTSKLMDVTEWKKAYATRILNGLKKKGIVKVLDDNITVEGFGHVEERRKWDKVIKDITEQEKKKEEEKKQRQLARQQMFKQQMIKKKKVAKSEQIEELEPSKPVETTEDILDSLDAISAVDEKPPKLSFKSKPGVKTLPLPKKAPSTTPKSEKVKSKTISKKKDVKKKETKEELTDLTERDLEDLVPEKIMEYNEKMSILNGGIVQYDLIKEYVMNALKDVGEVPEDLIKAMLTQLQELQMIQSTMKIGGWDFYLFNELKFDFFEKRAISLSIDKPPLKKEELLTLSKWKEDRLESTLKNLQDKGILKIEGDVIIIPGIVQKKE